MPPWNDNSNSGQKPPSKPESKGPKPSPWGEPPSAEEEPKSSPSPGRKPQPMRKPSSGPGSGPTPPDFNEMSQQFGDRLKSYLGGSGGGSQDAQKKIAVIVAGVIGILYLGSGIYIVPTQNRAVITTFGAYSGEAGQGPHYRLPWPIQAVKQVPFTTLNKIDIGGAEGASLPEESLMLTGDENIVDLKFTVQWKVSNARAYVFNVKNPDETVRAVAESAMREVIGRTSLTSILTNGQGQVQIDTAKLMQRILDSYNTGVYIDEVQLRNPNVPPKVIDAFREVAAAKQAKVATINQAQGSAAQIRQEALGYQAQVVQEAEGEAARFNQVYAQYKAAPAVTRQRLYIETMERVLTNSRKVVIDSKGASAPIVLSPDSFRPRAPAASSGGTRP